MRFLLLVLLFWAALKLVKSLTASRPGPGPRPGRPRADGPRPVGGELVQDPQCGVYVPKETAVRGGRGSYFCSEACRRAHEARGS